MGLNAHLSDFTSDYSDIQEENSDWQLTPELTDYPTIMVKTPDDVRKRLLELTETRGEKSLRQLSINVLGRSPSYLSDFLDGSPVELDLRDAAKIAKKLGVSPTELGVDAVVVDNTQPSLAETNSGRVGYAVGTKSFLEQPRDLPILGSVRAGAVGFFLDQGEIQGMTRRPASLDGVANAFAVYVRDESMVPAFKQGWVVHVHPTRPVDPGDNVIIELTDGQAFVKELVRRTAKEVICRQWNPAQEVKYPASKVKSIMLVVASGIEG